MDIEEEAIIKFKKLFQKSFKVFIFDYSKKEKGGLITLRLNGLTQEIDGLVIKDNFCLLISIYAGKKEGELKKKQREFFPKLKKIQNLEIEKFKVSNEQSKSGKQNKTKLSEIEKIIKENSKYKLIIKKLLFCPNLILKEKLDESEDEKIIDKKLYEYFTYGLGNIGYDYIEKELFYFLNIEKTFINLSRSYVGKPTPSFARGDVTAVRLDMNKDKQIFSLCVPVEQIIDYVQVLRLSGYSKEAFQRMINGRRLKNISDNYLKENKSFPNSIILAFNPKYYSEDNYKQFVIEEEKEGGIKTKIKFIDEYGSLIIIDGQHRLLAHLIDKDKHITKPILINIIFFSKDNKQAFDSMRDLFYTINTEQRNLSALVKLKILSKSRPDKIQSRWYSIFEELNKINQKDNYLFNKICLEESELRDRLSSKDKVSIVSVVYYAGIKEITYGNKKKKIKGINSLNGDNNKSYINILRKYFSIIGELVSKSKLNARDIGGLIRLLKHFANDNKTKPFFEKLSKEDKKLSTEIKNNILKYLKQIPFSKLDNLLEYSGNDWAPMEGFFVGCIRKQFKGFGIGNILSKDGKKALKKGKKFK